METAAIAAIVLCLNATLMVAMSVKMFISGLKDLS